MEKVINVNYYNKLINVVIFLVLLAYGILLEEQNRLI